MSIVDAIRRAKQLGREREAGMARPQPAENPRVEIDADIHPAKHLDIPEPVVSVPRPEFPELPFNLRICTEKHIIVPGIDEEMSQKASPSYRMLRTRLLQRCRNNRWSTLAITSPGPGEGKSVTSINLAISIAREGNHDVFLIDLDMRNPSVCRYLGITPKHDVTDFFSGNVAANDVFFGIGVERLTLAGGTLGTTHASELLATDHLEQLLAYIRSISSNSLVLIDLPPIVNTDDALIVAPRVDATVLVVSEGITKRDSLDRAIGLLADFKVAGVVLNRTNESVGSEYYGS